MHILAIDAGTTGITALVLDAKRGVVGRAYAEITQHRPQSGWVEHDATQILDVALHVAKGACREAKVAPNKMSAIGITNQRETTVLWGRVTGDPLHHAIVWQDRRTAKACDKVPRKVRKLIAERTGLVPDPYFSASKLQWLLDNVDGARKRAEGGELAFGTVDSWLAWKLTGEHVTDVTNASRTMLWDIHASAWDDELLAYWNIPRGILPTVVPSSHRIGPVKALGGAPLCALVGDQQAALFGQACHTAGEAKVTYGTGCFLLQHTGTHAIASRHGLLTTRAASLDETPQYALEGSVFIGGAAIQWLRDGLEVITDAPGVNALAAEVEDSGGVVIVPAFAGLGAPHWDPHARGAILGISGATTKAHIARATLEAIAFQSADVLRAMEKDAKAKGKRLRVDGGAAQSDLLLQIQADILGRPVVRPDNVETTALGAAYLAGLAVEVWTMKDLQRAPETVIKPGRRHSDKTWQRAVKTVRTFKP